MAMDQSKPSQPQTSLFQVYLRLRPPLHQNSDSHTEPFLTVENPDDGEQGDAPKWPTHITVQPPNDARKRAIERFGFTKVFQQDASQLDIFQETGAPSLIKGVLQEGRDALFATLGVTGSGKTHTILGSKSQKGLTQMSLDVLFRSLASTIRSPDCPSNPVSIHSLAASDPSEAHIYAAKSFIESVYGDPSVERGPGSRAQTPMASSRSQTPLMVWNPISPIQLSSVGLYSKIPSPTTATSPRSPVSSIRLVDPRVSAASTGSWWNTPPKPLLPSQKPFWNSHKTSSSITKPISPVKDTSGFLSSSRRPLTRPSTLPQSPDVSELAIPVNPDDEYVVLISMYEVYNDRIFDLLAPASGLNASRQGGNQKEKRKHLIFKPTEGSTDRKVVSGLRKIVCGTYEEALMVLEAGLTERKVTGTESNSVSSRSHGFFCVEVKKKIHDVRWPGDYWVGNTLTIVDLAGSERARNARTAGATLAEAGKINESLMYLGQCLQMQGNFQDGNRSLVPFRQCKLTELLFSNSFPSASNNGLAHNRHPQRAVMIVNADAQGDFNATTQILRYSALARDVTVPRVPSVTSTVVPPPPTHGNSKAHAPVHQKSFLYPASAEELEAAALEIAKITDDYKALAIRLAEEEMQRAEAEFRMKVAEEKCLTIEQDVREECWAEMEERMDEERRRWQRAWDEQASRHDELLDKKIDLLSNNFKIHEDPEPSSAERIEELEQENDMLRARIATLERELHSRSPTKTSRNKKNFVPGHLDSFDRSNFADRESDVENATMRMRQLKLQPLSESASRDITPKASTLRRPKRLTTRQRDLGPEHLI